MDKLTALAEELLKHEVIFKENLENIFGKRPWLTSEEKVQAALLQNQPLEAGIPVETGADVSVQETASEEAENDPQGNA